MRHGGQQNWGYKTLSALMEMHGMQSTHLLVKSWLIKRLKYNMNWIKCIFKAHLCSTLRIRKQIQTEHSVRPLRSFCHIFASSLKVYGCGRNRALPPELWGRCSQKFMRGGQRTWRRSLNTGGHPKSTGYLILNLKSYYRVVKYQRLGGYSAHRCNPKWQYLTTGE